MLSAPVLSVFLLSPDAQQAAPISPPAQVSGAAAARVLTSKSAPLEVEAVPAVPAQESAAAAAAESATPAVRQAPSPSQITPAAAAVPAASAATPALAAPRRQVAGSAVRYLTLPPVEVPRASRRAGEHGTVWLRVVVDAAGLPVQVSVQRSSGHARLDEQALWAMRQARFKPHTEDGRAVEVEVVAPIEYPAD
jgi:protein TonB